MTTTNAEFRALAEAARMDATDWYDLETLHDFLRADDTVACGPFIVEASPARIIELLTDNDRLDKACVDISAHATALRTKLDIALRALERVASSASSHPWIMLMAKEASETLAQLKEQP